MSIQETSAATTVILGKLSRNCLFALLLLPAAGAAQEQHQHPVAKGGPEGMKMRTDGLGASAVFDSRGTLWAVHKDGERVVARRSEDFGRSWAAPRPVNAMPEPIGADGDARPKIAAGLKGELYVTWTKPLSKPFTGDIRFSRSVDGAKTFSPPLTVHTDRQEITHRFDSVAVNRDGRVFIAWVDKRDGEAARAKRSAYGGAAVYFAVSDDGGATFRGDFKLADHSCECCRIALLPREDGSVLAMWRHVFEPNVRDHALARMEASGRASGFRRATFEDWKIDVCPHHGPSLVADARGRLHAVWFSQAPKHAGVFYGRLVENGVDGRRRIGGETAEHADLAIAGERLAVVWKEFDGERSQLRATVSRDAGGNCDEAKTLAVTAAASDQPRILAIDGRFYAFWNTRFEPLKVVPLP